MLTVPCGEVSSVRLQSEGRGQCARCLSVVQLSPDVRGSLLAGHALRTLCPDCWRAEVTVQGYQLAAGLGHHASRFERVPGASMPLLTAHCANARCRAGGMIRNWEDRCPAFEGELFEDPCPGESRGDGADPLDRAYREGQLARMQGKQCTDNPYPSTHTHRPSRHNSWLAGFHTDLTELVLRLDVYGESEWGAEHWQAAVDRFSRCINAALGGSQPPTRRPDFQLLARMSACQHLQELRQQHLVAEAEDA